VALAYTAVKTSQRFCSFYTNIEHKNENLLIIWRLARAKNLIFFILYVFILAMFVEKLNNVFRQSTVITNYFY